MKLLGLYINGYGILHDFSLGERELFPGPCIIYGLNEAGKSTLLSFIRAVLFGFKAEGGSQEPLRGGQVGGALLLEDGGAAYRVERYGKGNGKVVVHLPGGGKAGEELLRNRILRGMSPVLFKNVFAFGMDELRRMEELEKDEVSAHIYGAGTGTGPQKLAYASGALEKMTGELFKARGRTPVLNKLLSELDALERRIRDLEQQPARYEALRDQLRELEQTNQKMRDALNFRQQRLRRLENLIKAREPWNEWQACLARQRDEEQIESFPEDGPDRLGRLETRREEKIAEVREWADRAKNIKEKLHALVVDDSIIELAVVINNVNEERPLYLEKKQNMVELEAITTANRKAALEKLNALGPGWDEKKVAALDTSLVVRRQIDDFSTRFRNQEQRITQAANSLENKLQELAHRQAEVDDLRQQLASLAPAQPQDGSPSPTEKLDLLEQATLEIEKLRNNRSLLEVENRRLEDIDGRKSRAEQILYRLENTPGSRWPVMAAILLSLLGVGVVFFNTVLGLLVLVGGLGLAVLISSVLAGQAREKSVRREELTAELTDLEALRITVEEEAGRLKRECDNTALQLSRAALALTGREKLTPEEIPGLRRALQAELENRRRRNDLNARLDKAVDNYSRAQKETQQGREELERQQKALQTIQEEWRAWLARKGLPALNTTGAADFIALAEKATDAVNKLSSEIKLLEQTKAAAADYEGRVKELAGLMGLGVNREEIAGFVSHMAHLLKDQLAVRDKRMRWQQDLQSAQEKANLAMENLKAVESDLRELLNSGGAVDGEDFRRRAKAYREQKDLARRAQELQRQMLNIAGSPDEVDDLLKEMRLTTRSQHETERQELQTSIADLEKELAWYVDEIAAKKQELKRLENGDELARARQQRDMARESLAIRAREWQVTALCAALLEMAREKHERERQPAVLARASKFISPMTEGRYNRVLAPVGAAARLVAEEPGGRRVPAPYLSRGAAGQLYLAIRMALACHFSSVVTPMPIILDDILVDFDARRLRGTLQVVDKIAREHQVIIFTCHDYVLEAARQHLSRCSLVRLADGCQI